jgi:hypothetical protein
LQLPAQKATRSRGVPEWNPEGRNEAQVGPRQGFVFHDMIANVFGQFGGVRSRHEMTRAAPSLLA